ncbi:MAG: GIY-YIG nuclease family protein [Planctomycetes bacterium]|nr:GIY-YIG nuclease family protein [Planctomycetota bacterium]
MANKYFIYILESIKDNRYYIGSTADIPKRLEYHNKGLSIYTRRFKPWRLRYQEEFNSLKEARSRELALKRWKNHQRISALIERGRSSIG